MQGVNICSKWARREAEVGAAKPMLLDILHFLVSLSAVMLCQGEASKEAWPCPACHTVTCTYPYCETQSALPSGRLRLLQWKMIGRLNGLWGI